MKLTKGRIHKIMTSRHQTAKAFHGNSESRKRGASDFTRKNGKYKGNGLNGSSILNKTMYRTKHLKEQIKDPIKE